MPVSRTLSKVCRTLVRVYSVKHAATLTGISPATLRMWERRYNVVEPARSPSGYRLYDDQAVARLRAMNALVAAGWSPRLAAAQVKSGTTTGAAPGPDAEPAPGSTPTFGDLEALAGLADDFDGPALDLILDEAFAGGEFEEVVDGWLMPALHHLGGAWHQGNVTVAGEHFVSATVHRRLATILDATAAPTGAPRVIVGLARGSRHELGVLAFATALRRAGLDVVYVGGDLPPESWVVSVAGGEPAAVVLGVPTADDVPAARETLAALTVAQPDVPVYVGGRQQDVIGGASRRLGHDIGAAARTVAADLAG